MKILNIKNGKTVLTYLAVLLIGILIGWLLIGGTEENGGQESLSTDHAAMDHAEGTIWTCSMHPQIQKDEPGNCPICGMELIPMKEDEDDGEAGQYSVKLSNAAMKIAEVEMTTIQKKAPYKEVYLPGKVMADERNIAELTARYPGRIEKLMVNFTGQEVRKGQVLAKIYSPELVTAQRELFEAIKFKETNPSYYKASRNKLKLWDLTDAQIDQIEKAGDVDFYFDVLSPISGTVTMRHIALGDYVKEGTALFQVVDLSHVWVMFDAYESDIPWIKMRDKIKFSIKSIPGREFESTVTFIDPVLNPMSRVAKVRAELDNPRDLLKPEMLADGILKTMLPGSGDQLVVPKSAVLWTGKKAVVYVMTSDHNNMFQYREIELGADAGDYYVIEAGLNEGEMVATHGVFKIDAAAQLKGEKSMMNPEGGKVSMGHNHGAMTGDKKATSVSDHGAHNMSQEEPMIMEKDMQVSEIFKEQLTEVYLVHLELQNAMYVADGSKVKIEASDVKESLEKVDMSLVKGEMHNHWMMGLPKLTVALDRIKGSDDIEEQRLAYADFTDALYSVIKMFGVVNETIYYQFCPMARNGEGAYWLSPVKEIKNPYYGDAMSSCGENKEVID
ncbi:MAG: efflux transporter periplasmic adaptor subunit [Flammeovirgaceae bacterium]|nr:efflux transporter periplasmic adaptor subunit [Flammeovirgaceae bacterium]MBE63034.1 efflux transporter periplasmic adaptor subunit [Flammeovirgaceae bacterium]|tara:strand:- start:1192 stop:3036 length:1845 start_codon:yes stop_codon:yes gene_type:complete